MFGLVAAFATVAAQAAYVDWQYEGKGTADWGTSKTEAANGYTAYLLTAANWDSIKDGLKDQSTIAERRLTPPRSSLKRALVRGRLMFSQLRKVLSQTTSDWITVGCEVPSFWFYTMPSARRMKYSAVKYRNVSSSVSWMNGSTSSRAFCQSSRAIVFFSSSRTHSSDVFRRCPTHGPFWSIADDNNS